MNLIEKIWMKNTKTNTYYFGTWDKRIFLPWDGNAKSSYGGEVRAIEVNPFNLYPDPLYVCRRC